MARIKIIVDKNLLIRTIENAEETNTFKTQDEMFKFVAEQYNIHSNQKISYAVVGLRIKEWEIPVKTQKARNRKVKAAKEPEPTREPDDEKEIPSVIVHRPASAPVDPNDELVKSARDCVEVHEKTMRKEDKKEEKQIDS